MKTSLTREKIMDIATILFADRGYENVSMRDIAAEVGITASSIYNHFPSKLSILKDLYELYARERKLVFPNTEDMLSLLETGHIDDVLAMASYYWPPHIKIKMDRIILIASQRILIDKDSEDFLRENFFEALMGIWVPLLSRGMELGKIRMVDIGSFTKLLTFYAFSAAELNCTKMKVSFEQWNHGLSMLYSLLKPLEE